jgi:hypothetical protein
LDISKNSTSAQISVVVVLLLHCWYCWMEMNILRFNSLTDPDNIATILGESPTTPSPSSTDMIVAFVLLVPFLPFRCSPSASII